MTCFIITFYAQVLCLMTTLSDVQQALYSSLVSWLLRKLHAKEKTEQNINHHIKGALRCPGKPVNGFMPSYT